MVSKVITVLAALAASTYASAPLAVAPAPLAVAPAPLAVSEVDPYPQYSFAYDVKDVISGDFKSQVETRNGGVVQGQYSVVEPDGTRRQVDYVADPVNGFNAVVSKLPLARAIPAAPVVAPAPVVAAARVAPAPVVAPAAPLARAAPVVAPARLAAPYGYAYF
ncbi:larval cuticle protein A2B-like [Agrilus planipennis]|uniref:Larval cuticle protein A2B-like n=1 Tax=Agrilus planipennis TaxID=224129 RepID=A0A1W4WJ83_AGRPL|nr:larval cuticle protein A2B-like [Agrilus planipennis]